MLKYVLGFILLATPVFAQTIDQAKLAPLYQQQRDAANNQVAVLAAQLQDALERIKTLEAENTKLKTEKKE